MNPDWQRIKQVLAEAVARSSPAERAVYLDGACRNDSLLRAQIEKLLKAHDQAGAFLETPAIPVPEMADGLNVSPCEQPGGRIGPYRLLQSIGEGGCGVVYLAEQEQPIRRRVALKVIKLGMDTKAVIVRFEAERQALALMDHPNIARVLDAGATDTGRPYFVMELVQGIKITEYCDQCQLSTEARLRLFFQVCLALQHAHQKGVIHRDIKPSNILVAVHDGLAAPKVIDFGIAKATDRRLTEQTLATVFGQCVGTPAYMSPEQASMSVTDIDTRSDVYALGVLLYELLTGHTPFDQQGLIAAGLDEMRRIIREQEPARPSTRLSTLTFDDQVLVAGRRQSEPPQLVRRLRGDLDWIVMRCLEKDRARRYETANSLAEDIARHLNHEPVTARPPSRRYRFQKLVQRNQATCAAAGMVMLALVAGLGFSLWTLAKERAAKRQALAAEQKAQSEAGKSRQVAQFLKDMLHGFGPSAAAGRDTTMLLEILDQTAERLGKHLKGQPEVDAELRTTLGEVYQALARHDQAEAMLREALRLHRTLWGEMNTNVADAMDALGHELASDRGESAESAALIGQALTIRTHLLGTEHAQVAASLHHLGEVQLSQSKLTEADELFQRALAMRRRLLGNGHIEVAESLTTLANTRYWQARHDEAEVCAREALAILSRVVPDQRALLTAASARTTLGEVLRMQGRVEEALDLQREGVRTRKSLLGGGHPGYASSLYYLACALKSANRLEEAETAIREALAVNQPTVGGRLTISRDYLAKLGEILGKAGRFAEAEAAYREAFPCGLCPGLIKVLRAQGKLAEAEARMASVTAEATEVVQAVRTQLPSEYGVAKRHSLAAILWYQGRIAESEALLEEAMETANHFEPSVTLVENLSFQAMRNAALEVWFVREAEHTALCRRWLMWAEAQPGFVHKGRAAAMINLRAVTDRQLQAGAFSLARHAAESAPNNALLVWYRLTQGVAAYRLGHYSEAERILSESEQGGPSVWHPAARTCTSKFFRAMMLFRQGKLDAARRLFNEAEAATTPLPEAVQWSLAEGADYDDLMLWLAFKEARGLLNPPSN